MISEVSLQRIPKVSLWKPKEAISKFLMLEKMLSEENVMETSIKCVSFVKLAKESLTELQESLLCLPSGC